MKGPAAARIAAEIERNGAIAVDRFVELALYSPEGFYGMGRGAGRSSRDFITSPETGDTFGRLVARRLDEIWSAWDRPAPFCVVEVGAGRGRLAQSILRAEPECSECLRYVVVERSPELLQSANDLLHFDDASTVLAHDGDDLIAPGKGPRVVGLDTLPRGLPNAVLLANELLDNLPFGIEYEVDGDWRPIHITVQADVFVEVGDVTGPRRPVLTGWNRWLADARGVATRNAIMLFDYGASLDSVIARSPEWLRTYRNQSRGSFYLDSPGSQDITIDIPTDVITADLAAAGFADPKVDSQADWLRARGADALLEQAAKQSDAAGSLRPSAPPSTERDAIPYEHWRAQSVRNELAALLDPSGLGSFFVVEAGER